MLSSVEQAFVGRDEIGSPLACVAGFRKGKGSEGARPRAREEGRFLSFPLAHSRGQIPSSLSMLATQARAPLKRLRGRLPEGRMREVK